MGVNTPAWLTSTVPAEPSSAYGYLRLSWQKRRHASFGVTADGGELGLVRSHAGKAAAHAPPILTSSGVTIRFTSVAASKNRIQRAITLDGAWETGRLFAGSSKRPRGI